MDYGFKMAVVNIVQDYFMLNGAWNRQHGAGVQNSTLYNLLLVIFEISSAHVNNCIKEGCSIKSMLH